MFVRAQAMANESGRTAFVVYDSNDRSYYAQTDYTDEDRDCGYVHLIVEVEPRVTEPCRRKPDPIKNMTLAEQMTALEQEMQAWRERNQT
jgi:hypothetical protein